jgi:acyl carrier protein
MMRMVDEMKRLVVLDRVRDVLAKVSGRNQAEMPETMRLNEDLELNSLERVEAGMELENEFAIALSDYEVDMACMGTVGGIVDYLIGEREVA